MTLILVDETDMLPRNVGNQQPTTVTLTSQTSDGLNYFAAEAWNLTLTHLLRGTESYLLTYLNDAFSTLYLSAVRLWSNMGYLDLPTHILQ